jgi:hypothetical protein
MPGYNKKGLVPRADYPSLGSDHRFCVPHRPEGAKMRRQQHERCSCSTGIPTAGERRKDCSQFRGHCGGAPNPGMGYQRDDRATCGAMDRAADRPCDTLMLQPGFRPSALCPPALMDLPRARPAWLWRNPCQNGSDSPSRTAHRIASPCRIASRQTWRTNPAVVPRAYPGRRIAGRQAFKNACFFSCGLAYPDR